MRTEIKTNSKRFFSSDKHYGHQNIIRFCNRPYDNVHDMEEDFIHKHNSLVTDNDDYYDLGDVGYRCSAQHVSDLIRRMNGRIHIILGNHDKPLRQAIKRGLLQDLFESGKLEVYGSIDPDIITAKILNIDGARVVLSHYAYRTWPAAFRGTIHLFAHSHGNLSDFYRSFDIGVDSKNGYPWEWNQILEKIKEINEENFKEE